MSDEQNDAFEHGATMIAVTGMACRFAGAADLDGFWKLLRGDRPGLHEQDESALRQAGVGSEALADPAYVRVNGSLDGALAFDAAMFGYSPEEAALLDPQQRVLLEACWHALEDAGLDPAHAGRTGIYAGVGFNTYLFSHLASGAGSADGLERWRIGIGNDKDTATSRVAYKLGLTGPAVTVQTACSTSLVAVHLACQALLDGDCDTALAGGASVRFPLGQGYRHHAEGIEAVDGRCRPFSPASTGTVFADGVGVVVLRHYEEALASGDRIYAVIRGSAVNNDADRKVGFTAPGVQGQVEVIRAAHASAGVHPHDIDYVEAHGTGTVLGDKLEGVALDQAFAGPFAGRRLLGAVKGHIGHADTAAGIAGLIKTALSLHHGVIPATLHDDSQATLAVGESFEVSGNERPWPRGSRRRLAGVSSFGIGGTNAHVVMSEAPEAPSFVMQQADRQVQVMPLAASDPDVLREHVEAVQAHVHAAEASRLAGIARTMRSRAHRGLHRAALVVMVAAGLRTVCTIDGDGAPVDAVLRDLDATALEAAQAWVRGETPAWSEGQRESVCKESAPLYPFKRTHVEYPGFTMRASGPAVDAKTGTVVARQEWLRRTERIAVGPAPSGILLLATGDIPAALAEALSDIAPLEVWRHAGAPPSAGKARLFDFASSNAWDDAWAAREGRLPGMLVYVDLPDQGSEGFERSLCHAMTFAGTLGAVLETHGFPTLEVHWLSGGIAAIDGPGAFGAVATWGPARVLSQELPSVRSRWYDVAARDSAKTTWRTVADLLLEPVAPEREEAFAVFAVRGSRVFTPSLLPVARPSDGTSTSTVRRGGTYLVTGGAGGIGRHVAAWLVSSYEAKVIACGRRSVEALDDWQTWVAAHPGVHYVQADVTDDRQLRALAAGLERGLHTFDGVFHCAGVAGERTLAGLRGDSITDASRSKVGGALALLRVFREVRLDFLVLFGSVNASLGGIGQAEYASANAFLDVLAKSGAAPWRTVCVAWDTWRGTGMAQLRPHGLPGDSGDGASRLRITLPAHSWLLHEHRIDGVPILPGMAHLALLFDALSESGLSPDLADVVFHAPVTGAGDDELVLSLTRPSDGRALDVRDSGGRVVCSARVPEGAGTSPHPLPDVVALFDPATYREITFRPPERIELGSRWSGIVQVIGAGQWFRVDLELAALAGDFGRWPFHPALMDLALAPLQMKARGFSVPVSIARVSGHASLEKTRHAYVLMHEGEGANPCADVWLVDAGGHVLLSMQGVRFQPLTPGAVLERALSATAFDDGLAVKDALDNLQYMLNDSPLEAVFVGAASPDVLAGRVEQRCRAYRRQLRQRMTNGAVATDEPVEQRVATLCAIIAEHLGYASVAPDDRFFALGGDSLSGLLVIDAARRAGIALTMAALYRADTIAELAGAVASVQEAPATAVATPFMLLDPGEREALPAKAIDAFPLSLLQQGIQYYRARYGTAIYRDILWAHLQGAFDTALFEAAWTACCSRHAVLRTEIVDRGGCRPLQWVRAEGATAAVVQPLVGRTLDAWLAEAQPQIHMPMGPAVHLLVLTEGASFYVLFLLDDALLDGWSATSLMAELIARYGAALDGRPQPAMPPPRLGFHDYVHHEQEALRNAALVSFWRERTREAVPTRVARFAEQGEEATPDIAIRIMTFAAGALVDDAARQYGVSAKIILLAAYLRALACWCGVADVTTGLETHTRLEAEGGTEVLGLHLNTLPMSFRFAPMSVASFVAAIHQAEGAIMAHRHLPLVEIQRTCAVPLFDNCFNYTHFRRLQDIAAADALSPALRLLGYFGEEKTNYPFKLWVDREATSGRYQLYVAFDRNKLAEPDAGALARLFDDVLATMAAEPKRDILTVGTKPSAAEGWYGSEESLVTLAALVGRVWQQPAGAVAVRDGQGTHGYAVLAAIADGMLTNLVEAGCRPGSVVAISLPRCMPWIAAMLAVVRAGATLVLLDPNLPRERIDAIQRLARPDFVVQALTAAPGWAVRAIAGTKPAGAREPVGDLEQLPAYLVFTSGSTGVPKAVAGTRRGLANRIAWHHRHLPVGPGDVYLSRTAQSFVDVFFEVFGPLSAGATLDVMDDAECRDAERIVQRLVESGATHMVIVPTLLAALLDHLETRPLLHGLNLRHVSVSGELFPTSLLQRAEALLPGVRWLNIYGSSEVAADVAVFEYLGARETLDGEAVAVGVPIANVSLYLLDANLVPVPDGCEGELFVGGVALANGYLGNASETALRFLPNPFAIVPGHDRLFRTGDLARRGPNGLTIVGRCDRQVKVRGVRVDLDGIEVRLETLPGVKRACVVLHDGTPAAYLEFADGDHAKTFWPALRSVFTPEERPHPIWRISRMPLTATGKINRPAVSSLKAAPWYEQGEPLAGASEEKLATLWRQLLPEATIFASTRFDEVGGHSLLLLQLAGAIEHTFGRRPSIASLLAAPTLREQARLVGDAEPEGSHVLMVRSTNERTMPFAPTPLQQAYWVARQGAGGGSHFYQEWDIPQLDTQRFAHAWSLLVARHEMLRARMTGDGWLVVMSDPSAAMVMDLRALDDTLAGQTMLAWRETHAFTSMDAARGPLCEMCLFQLPEGRCVIAAKIDFIVADAWSIGILARELWSLYADPSLELAPVEITFRDVIASRAREAAGSTLLARSYWTGRLAGFPGAPELPVRPTPATARSTMRRREMYLDRDRAQALIGLAKRWGMPASSVLLAAYAAVLQRWSIRKSFVLTLTTFDRPFVHPHVNRVVGDFTSVMWLEVADEGVVPFETFTRVLHRRLVEDLDHASFSGVELLREARRQGFSIDPGAFVFTHIPELDDIGTRLPAGTRERYRITRTAGVWIDNQVVGESGGLRLHWDTWDEKFVPGVLDEMFVAYRELVLELADFTRSADGGPSCEIHLPADMLERRRGERAATDVGLDAMQAIARACVEHGERIAVLDGDSSLSYAEVWRRSRLLAARLRAEVSAGEAVAIRMASGWRYVVAVLATQLAGVAYVPISLQWPKLRACDIIASYGIGVVLADEHPGDDDSRLVDLVVLHVDAAATDPKIAGEELTIFAPEALAYVMFTSGSTGEPKGVMMNRRGVANTLYDMVARLGMTPADRVLALSDPGFDLSVFDMLAPLMVGASVVFPEQGARLDPAAWWRAAQALGVTIWNSAPALFDLFADYAAGKVERIGTVPLRWVLLSGDWISLRVPDLLRRIAPRARLLSLGGATEAGIWSVAYPVGLVAEEWTSIPYGRPLRGQACDILDAHGRSCPTGVVGELVIEGDSLSIGYWQRPHLTASSFVVEATTGRRRYRTGDLARYRGDGTIELIGRIDHQVKIRGQRIECGEVEHVISSCKGVRKALVLATKGNDGLPELHAMIECGDDLSLDAVREHSAARLPERMLPRHWHCLDALPITDNGKIDRRALVAMVEAADTQELARWRA